MRISRITFIVTALLLVCVQSGTAVAGNSLDRSLARSEPEDSTGVLWYDIRHLDIEGRGWSDTKDFFDRFPAKAEEIVSEQYWTLSQNSSGMCVRFVTDAVTIHTRWELRDERLDMPHMAATGVSGLDLYVKAEDGQWRWIANGRPMAFPVNTSKLIDSLPPGTREYILYLPLYNGVTSVEIGIPEESTLSKAELRESGRRKPIVFYGQSITQGACASRPGMCYPSIIGRWLDYPVINLGFSGNGKMEPEIAELLAENT